MGVKRSRIYDHLLNCGQNVTLRDVDNMIQRARQETQNLTDDDATAEVVARFASEDPDNVITVDETDLNETGVVSVTSKYMRQLYMRFPELLLIDTTHKTNRYNYQLLTLMVMDEVGVGQPVQHSVMETNGNWHMERAIRHFKRAHPDSEAQVLICHFHVIKYLGTMCRKPEFGKMSQDDLNGIDALVHGMVYAQSAEEYEMKRSSLRQLCDRVGCSTFFEYMERNWHTCQEKWVLYHRAKLPHLKNHTNNRLESFFGKFKDGLPCATSMSTMLTELFNHDRRQHKEAAYRQRPGGYTNPNYDEELQDVLRFTNPWVAKHVASEYTAALNKWGVYKYEDVPGEDAVQVVGHRPHVVSLADWRCDCDFAMTMMLPCRHAMALRKERNVRGPVIPLRRIDERWTCSSVETPVVPIFVLNEFATTKDDDSDSHRVGTTPAERYKRALQSTNRIAAELAECSDDKEFEEFEA
ncbi:hypothetical protein ATCC90586_011952 [Pythium insidiosum]|nr:hypothetical protein ATCC90586_011952 [Pythium insidiosum]